MKTVLTKEQRFLLNKCCAHANNMDLMLCTMKPKQQMLTMFMFANTNTLYMYMWYYIILTHTHTHTHTHARTHTRAHTHTHTHTHTQPCASGILPTEAKSESLSENSVRIWGGFTLILLLLVYIPLTWHVALAKMKMVNSTTRSSIVKMSKHTTKLCEKLSKHWRDCALCVL